MTADQRQIIEAGIFWGLGWEDVHVRLKREGHDLPWRDLRSFYLNAAREAARESATRIDAAHR